MFFFRLNSLVVALILFTAVTGATALGHLVGRSEHDKPGSDSESFGVMQAAMRGFMGLVLAFGLSLAVGRYEDRRAAIVEEFNAIGTTYLRAQTLQEPVRTRSMDLLRHYTDTSIRVAGTVPSSVEQEAASRRVYGLDNRVPTSVLALEVGGAAIALALLALHLAALGRTTVLVAAVLVSLMLVITVDLDRPVRGLIQISPPL